MYRKRAILRVLEIILGLSIRLFIAASAVNFKEIASKAAELFRFVSLK
jgi:hypothetical protein